LLQSEIQLDLGVDFVFEAFLTEQRYLLISLGISLYSHHDTLPGVFCQLIENGVLGEIYELKTIYYTII
jgi:hypothetical protein